MEILFSQKIEFSTIIPFKNYSSIKSKIEYIPIEIEKDEITSDESTSDNPDDFTELFEKLEPQMVRNRNGLNEGSIYLTTPTNKKGKYFYLPKTPDCIEARMQIDLDFAFTRKRKSFSTTNERHLKQNYGNPFASIVIEKIERSIVKRDNKITIKLYHRYKRREVNWKYFRTSTTIQSITIDTNTGNFTLVDYINSSQSKRKVFRKNHFPKLLELVNNRKMFYMVPDNVGEEIKDEYTRIFDNEAFYDAINDAFGFQPTVNYDSRGLEIVPTNFILVRMNDFITNFMYYFGLTKKIKMPDNFRELFAYYYPTERYLKKNKRKLIAAILDRYKIKSKVTIKLLHTNPKIDICSLAKLCHLLGKDYTKYIGNIDPTNLDVVRILYNSIDYSVLSQIRQFTPTEFTRYTLSDVEKENIVSIINSFKTDRRITSPVPVKTFYGALVDHFDMINKLRPYLPGIYLNARNYTDFNAEHLEYSNTLSLIRRPHVLEYVYAEETVKTIEKRIEMIPFKQGLLTDEDFLYPVILKREEDYIEEGKHMHHCVGGYVDKEGSIIISLRSFDGKDRVTSQFNIKSGECQQSRHFYNGSVPPNFEYALEQLKNRVNALAKKDKLNWIEKKKVKVMINGVEISGPIERNNPQPVLAAIDEIGW